MKGQSRLSGARILAHFAASTHAAGPALVIIACLAAVPARAAVLSGSARSSLYLHDSRLGANAFETRVLYGGVNDTIRTAESNRHALRARVRVGEDLRLDAVQLRWKPLAFHTALTAANVVTDQSLQETSFRLYRAWLEWRKPQRGRVPGYDLRFGRHWVVAGVGSRTVDGLSAKVSTMHFGDLTLFGGTLGIDRLEGRDRFWAIDKPSESRAFGGRLRLARPVGPLEPQVAVSLAQLERTPRAVRVTDAQRLGVSAEIRPSRGGVLGSLRGARLWGDLRRDLLTGADVSLVGGIDYRSGWRGLFARAEYGDRRPDLRATSHFASFRQDAVHELRGGIGADLVAPVRLELAADHVTAADGDAEDGAELTASGYGLSAGYRLHRGYGGRWDGLVLHGHRDLPGRLLLDVSLGHTRFDYGDLPDDTDFDPDTRNESSGIVALGFRARPDLTLTGQVEGLENESMKHDVRFVGLVQWRFRASL